MYEPLERPPIDTSHLSLILTVPPARADASAALADWVGYLNGTELDYEILLASEDTGQPVEDLAASAARARALPPPERNGFGSAMKLALDQARHPLVFYARCDLCYRPADLKRLLQVIPKVDLAVGQRTFPDNHRSQRLYRWFVRALFAVRLHDLGCLFVLARRSIFARIPLQSHGLFAHTEILAKANFLGCLFGDASVTYRLPTIADDKINWADARRVISHPNFGPVHLRPEPSSEAAPAVEPQP
jgi:hypothetical protein